jgi:integrase/recombinase XerD
MKATTAVLLDTRREKQDGTYPVKIRITYQRKRKYYALGYSLTPAEFEKVKGERPRGDNKDLSITFNALESRAIKVIEKLHNFTFEAFEKNFLSKNSLEDDVYSYFERYIDKLTKEGRASSASNYQCSLNSIKEFHSKKLTFPQVTPDFLKDYERWMVAGGKSLTTVGIYCRCLRTLCNLAIEEDILTKQAYPFGKRKYQIPAGRNVKKALTIDDIQKIFDYTPANETEAEMRGLWLFSYLCNGINIKDVARLKYSNIQDGKITFVRAKTERTTKKNLKQIVAILTPEAEEIISRYRNPNNAPDNYVFSIIQPGVSPERERALVLQKIKMINKYMSRIAKECGIEKPVTTYTARHSFSTILKRSGAPIEFISESLGHQDLKTTEHYLDSFEDDVKKQYASFLTNFKKQ